MGNAKFRAIRQAYDRFSGLLFCVFILTVGHFNANYVVTDASLRAVLLALYFIISGLFLYGMFRAKTSFANIVSALLLPVLLFFLADHPVLLIPMIGIFVLYVSQREVRAVSIAVGFVFLAMYLFAGLIHLTFADFGEETTLAQIPSPNGQYILLAIARDEGALGGRVRVETIKKFDYHDFLTFFKKGKAELYRGKWDEKPVVAWADDHTVRINGNTHRIQ